MGHLLTEAYNRASTGRSSDVLKGMLNALRTDAVIQSDFSAETIRALRQRLSAFSSSSLFDSSAGDWNTFIKPGTVTVFLLARAPEDIRSVLAFLIIRRILEQRAIASEREKHALISNRQVSQEGMPRTWLVIDEAQNIMPSSKHNGGERYSRPLRSRRS